MRRRSTWYHRGQGVTKKRCYSCRIRIRRRLEAKRCYAVNKNQFPDKVCGFASNSHSYRDSNGRFFVAAAAECTWEDLYVPEWAVKILFYQLQWKLNCRDILMFELRFPESVSFYWLLMTPYAADEVIIIIIIINKCLYFTR